MHLGKVMHKGDNGHAPWLRALKVGSLLEKQM